MSSTLRNKHKYLSAVIMIFTVLSLPGLSAADTGNDTTTDTDKDMTALKTWQAGTTVSKTSIDRYGIDRCFQALPVTDNIFRRMRGRSFKHGCTTKRGDLNYLKVLHRNIDGEICIGELVCNKSISGDLITIFKALYNASYPIERMVLVDNYNADDEKSMTANNTSCFNYRRIGTSERLSNHSSGLAIDINPLYNPCIRKRKNGNIHITPAAGKPYAGRYKQFGYKINEGDICHKLFIKHGFKWGGKWRSMKDFQHFEKILKK